MLQCDGRSMVSCVGSQRRRLRDAAYMKAPSVRLAVHANMHVISDFWTGRTPLRLLGRRLLRQRRTVSTPPPLPKKTIRYPFLITHLENVTCVNSSRANIVKYLILKLKPDVNIIKRSKCVICTVCVSVPVSQGKSVYYLNANKDHLETQKSAIFINAGE